MQTHAQDESGTMPSTNVSEVPSTVYSSELNTGLSPDSAAESTQQTAERTADRQTSTAVSQDYDEDDDFDYDYDDCDDTPAFGETTSKILCFASGALGGMFGAIAVANLSMGRVGMAALDLAFAAVNLLMSYNYWQDSKVEE